jgi:hypothetical protein
MSDRLDHRVARPSACAGTSAESRVAVEKSGIDHAAADSFRDASGYLLMGPPTASSNHGSRHGVSKFPPQASRAANAPIAGSSTLCLTRSFLLLIRPGEERSIGCGSKDMVS